MHNSLDPQALASVTTLASVAPTEEISLLLSTEVSNAAVSARRPFVEPTVSASTDVLEVTQNFAQVTGSGIIP